MKKIPTIFIRDMSKKPSLVKDERHSDCQWVFDGEGVATRKWDGTCVMLDENMRWWARREVRPGKNAPKDFVWVQSDHMTGKQVGWEPIEQSSHFKTFQRIVHPLPLVNKTGTYELCGPRVNGNPERLEGHELLWHGGLEIPDAPRTFAGLRDFLAEEDIEGIVWHHIDGRMAKIKGRDFGLKR